MATTQNDNRAKFLELRKQGISVADARNQTYWPPPVVADATNPVTATSQINQDRLKNNQSRVQADIALWERPAVGTTPQAGQAPTPPPAPTVTWVDGQQFVQAPVDPTTGLSKPLEPVAQPAQPIQAEVKAPEPIKTEVASSTPTKTEPVIDYNVSAGREWEIQDNVAKITQTNPNLLKDRNAFNQAFGYETADAGKKALLDSTFSGQVKPSQDDIFNSMRAGVNVWDPKSTEFRQAQARIATFKKYSVYDTASLATSLQSGDLLVGTKAYNDLVSDPTMALKIQKAQAFNKWVVDLVKTGETQMANVLAQNPTVAQALEDGNLSKAEYDQLTNNAEVSAQGKLVEANKTKYETIKAQYDAVEDDVNTEYTGKEVTDSFKAKITADRRKGMYKDYQIASLEYQNSLGTYTNLKADSTALLAQNMELYKEKQTAEALVAKETRTTQQALAKEWRDEESKIREEKRKFEMEKQLKEETGVQWQSANITRFNDATWVNESTPVFYRKKTDWSFEAVDLSGNKIDSSVLSGGWFSNWNNKPWTLPTSFSGDTTSYIASKEWFRDTAYQDSAGVWTIGYGTTKINGKPIQPWQKITQAEAQAQLGADIAKHSNWKNYIDESTLSDSQKTALASFEYNLWPWIWDKWAVNIINMVKSGDLAGAGKEMQKYVNAGWKVIKGLQNRRAEEAKLLQTTWTSSTPTQNYSPDKIKSFEAFNWTAFPSDYKTPAQQKQYRDEYNAWRASRPWTKIETGNDILNIKIDKPTEWQSASQSYTSRMLNAVNNLIPLEKKFLELGTGWQVAQTYLPSLLKSSDQKMMDAEKKNFITAVLRKQSGASIAPSEFAGEEMKYFPQPWDSKEVVIAKQNARNAEIKAMLATAWVDAEWNSLSKYYNPPVIIQDQIAPQKTDKISTLKKNYFQ